LRDDSGIADARFLPTLHLRSHLAPAAAIRVDAAIAASPGRDFHAK
jgi:hypothetical protein